MVAKVLDFTRSEQTADSVGRPRELAVHCDAYRVTLPSPRSDGVLENPFERVILRLLDLGRYDVDGLASETCLPGDLVRFVLLRLSDKAYIDEHYGLLAAGRSALGKLDRAGAAERVDYSTHLIFRERIGGTLLPMLVTTSGLPLVESESGERLTVFVGSGRVHPRALGRRSGSHPAPTPREVEAVLARMRQRARILGTSGPSPSVDQGILIAPDPEPYLLCCKQVIQKFDSDWRITDPFGQGFSVDLERAYRKLLDQDETEAAKLVEWQSGIATQAGPRPEGSPGRHAFENRKNRELYPELVRSLNRADWYDAVEWALYYLDQSNDLTQAIQLATVRTAVENETAVLESAQELGFAVDGQVLRRLVDLRVGKIHGFRSGVAELATVLPLALLSAQQNPGHPLLGLAEPVPDLVETLVDLKRQRDDSRHGRTGAPRAESSATVGASPSALWAKQLIAALLPEFNFDGGSEGGTSSQSSVDDRLSARMELQSEFGLGVFAAWPTEVHDNLLDAEHAWLVLGHDGPLDATTFVNRLSTAAQSAFRQALDRMPTSAQVEGDYAVIAANRAAVHGLGPLPEGLRTVPQAKIERSLHGGFGTLGSVVVAYLVGADEPDLTRLERHQKTLLPDLERLIELRGHGNRTVNTDRQDCAALRRGIYAIIRSLLER